jgi:hypothetical protein
MKILIVHLGHTSQLLPATSVIKPIAKKAENPDITWVVNSEKNKYIFKYNKLVNRVISFDELQKIDEIFDVLINLHPRFPHKNCKELKIKNAFDYNFENEFKNFVDIIVGEKQTNINIFQLYFKLAGLTWKGEGYNVKYYPKTKSKKNRVGMAVAHANIRNYITEELDIKKIWYIPNKKNIFKKMDEINRCNKIITDDMTTFHLAMSLKKYVYFLRTIQSNIKLELFGNGTVFNVPNYIYE